MDKARGHLQHRTPDLGGSSILPWPRPLPTLFPPAPHLLEALTSAALERHWLDWPFPWKRLPCASEIQSVTAWGYSIAASYRSALLMW